MSQCGVVPHQRFRGLFIAAAALPHQTAAASRNVFHRIVNYSASELDGKKTALIR